MRCLFGNFYIEICPIVQYPMFSVNYTDDESMLFEVGKNFLELSGQLKVEKALSAKEAVEIIKEKEIDCIVSDYMMPETDGIEFLRQLRAEENNVPIILFTGREQEEIAIETFNAGAGAYRLSGDRGDTGIWNSSST